MEMNVLIYDNQSGYYDLIEQTVKNGFNLFKYSADANEPKLADYDVLVFFRHEAVETIDFINLYREDIPVILADGVERSARKGNVTYLDLSLTKDDIVKEIENFFHRLQAGFK